MPHLTRIKIYSSTVGHLWRSSSMIVNLSFRGNYIICHLFPTFFFIYIYTTAARRENDNAQTFVN